MLIEASRKAFESGKRLVVADGDLVKDLPLDVLVEGTGHPETGALHAQRAIESGWHIVMVSKEVDSVIGPELAERAARIGRVYTPVDGDQPSLLIGLISWARVLGLKILSAGKASEYDFVYHPGEGTVTVNEKTVPAKGMADLWNPEAVSPVDVARRRSQILSSLPQRSVPDLCEMAVVANYLGMPTGASHPRPVCDLVGRATRNLPIGFMLEMGGHHHTIEGVDAQLVDAAPMIPDSPAPFYMIANRRLLGPVAAGSIITTRAIDIDTNSILASLRKAQEERFFG